ncbi:Zn(2)-C6 fungal-type domain-containing protein [Mycena kentingensis (nom. inval.)]|nr:Zn(2)-C6 fungal-type domain-containing protein [Mycena kentingensis (nom. inval.)]
MYPSPGDGDAYGSGSLTPTRSRRYASESAAAWGYSDGYAEEGSYGGVWNRPGELERTSRCEPALWGNTLNDEDRTIMAFERTYLNLASNPPTPAPTPSPTARLYPAPTCRYPSRAGFETRSDAPPQGFEGAVHAYPLCRAYTGQTHSAPSGPSLSRRQIHAHLYRPIAAVVSASPPTWGTYASVPSPGSSAGASDGSERRSRGMEKPKQPMACLFCRKRKIACKMPDDAKEGMCVQCMKRGRSECVFPTQSRRGLHARAKKELKNEFERQRMALKALYGSCCEDL